MSKKSENTENTENETATRGGRRTRAVSMLEAWTNAMVTVDATARVCLHAVLASRGQVLAQGEQAKGLEDGAIYLLNAKDARAAAKIARCVGVEATIGQLGAKRLLSIGPDAHPRPMYTLDGDDGWTAGNWRDEPEEEDGEE